MALNWSWASASVIGSSHIRSGLPKQDAFTAFTVGKDRIYFTTIVCDGAGSTKWGGIGAYLSARILKKHIREYFDDNNILPSQEVIWDAIDEIRDILHKLADIKHVHIREFSTTLVGVITDGFSTVSFHIGDGSIVIKLVDNSKWEALSWPEHGEYASTTNFITETPAPKLKIQYYYHQIDSLAVFTDGIERLSLNFDEKTAHAPFFDGMFAPLNEVIDFGYSKDISDALHKYLGSEKINSRTDDDKTLVMAIVRQS